MSNITAPVRTELLAEYRCICGRLLFKAIMRSSGVQIKCRRCGALRSFGTGSADSERRYSFLVGGEGAIVAVSETMPAILGYSPDELCAMKVGELNPYVRSTARSHVLSFEPVMTHERHRTKEGALLQVLVHRESAGVPRQLELYRCEIYEPLPLLVRDAPGLGKTEHELFGEMDLEGRCRYVSEALAQHVGAQGADLLGVEFGEFLREEDAPRCRPEAAGSFRVPFTVDDVRFREYAEEPLRFHALPTWHDDGSARGFAFMFERK